MRTTDKLLKEEKELEEKLFATPETSKAKEETASTEEKPEDKAPDTEAPASDQSVTPETKTEDLKERGEDWEKRYKNLRASRDEKLYNAQKALATAQEQIIDLQQKLTELERAKPIETKDIFEGMSEEEREAIGDTALNAMKLSAQRVAEENRKAIDKELADLRELKRKAAEAEAKQSKMDAYDNFLSRLARAVPDYATIDVDPDFATYMQDLDIDGSVRADNFRRAESIGDVASVARYMLDFKSTKKVEKKNPLEDKITPEAKATSTPKVTDNKDTVLTWAQVNEHYDKFSKGYYRGRQAEYEAMEKRIDEAAARGLIRS